MPFVADTHRQVTVESQGMPQWCGDGESFAAPIMFDDPVYPISGQPRMIRDRLMKNRKGHYAGIEEVVVCDCSQQPGVRSRRHGLIAFVACELSLRRQGVQGVAGENG